MGTPLRSPEKAVIPDGLIPKPVIHGLAAIAREDHADRKEKLRFGQQATRLRQLRILREVYRLHLQNWSNKLIAERFGMSPSWVGKKLESPRLQAYLRKIEKTWDGEIVTLQVDAEKEATLAIQRIAHRATTGVETVHNGAEEAARVVHASIRQKDDHFLAELGFSKKGTPQEHQHHVSPETLDVMRLLSLELKAKRGLPPFDEPIDVTPSSA